MAATPAPRLVERSRQAARAEVARTGVALFLERGFDATTMDDVAAAAGISRRTLFRYFGSKEEVALGHLSGLGDELADALRAQPDDVDVWDALVTTFEQVLPTALAADDGAARALSQLVESTAALRAAHADKHRLWIDALTPAVAERLAGSPDPQLAARAVVGTVLACLDAATHEWLCSGDTRDVGELALAALRAVRGTR
ncbi:TetR family transcriptional regulator [Cellulomonas wangsupingiae]|uniref:TetR family transcriptional regulator n=1 Tax=Cellulomonas wangsupingiae TaxID=2968085 RepID=UPI001D0E9A66|nr:TetR family transcriptional regulator [Cellulomonas wangsupingiae]MCM0639605.1 TetR family transcriptional regulator [Cellulomonas wangsupingiae]